MSLGFPWKTGGCTIGEESSFGSTRLSTAGLDNENSYSPVARMFTVRALLSLAVERDMKLHQLVVESAFLASPLRDFAYIKPPQGVSDTKVSSCMCECLFLGQLIEEILNVYLFPITVMEDNQSCIHMAETLAMKRTKHVNVKYHFVKDLVTQGIKLKVGQGAVENSAELQNMIPIDVKKMSIVDKPPEGLCLISQSPFRILRSLRDLLGLLAQRKLEEGLITPFSLF
ncbi:hypothetical protein JTB14_023889 [Gonioctena quinquepunctata]|nr:hypothetical protein JTB14_023889 [Gonioctena quinquepunctata]